MLIEELVYVLCLLIRNISEDELNLLSGLATVDTLTTIAGTS